MLQERTQRAWFRHLLQYLARKWSGSVLTTLEPRQSQQQWRRQCYIIWYTEWPSKIAHISHTQCNYTTVQEHCSSHFQYVSLPALKQFGQEDLFEFKQG